MIQAFGGSCFGEQYIRCLAQRYVLQTRGLDLTVESGTRCLQLMVCLDIVNPYAAGYFCQYKKIKEKSE